SSAGSLTTPGIKRPSRIIITQPNRLSSSRLSRTKAPKYDADAPRPVKITEKPRTNAAVASATRPICRRRSAGRRSAMETPEMNERYPGISGTTQGEKNPSRPAANWRGGWSPPPATGVDATVVGTQVLTFVSTGMMIGAEAGPTVVKDGRTDTMVPWCEQMVTGTCAGTRIWAA